MQQTSFPHVLIVDDERMIADSLSLILKLHGYSVAAAYNGEQALERSQENPPDLLITDVVMPGINGFDLAVLIKQSYPNCRTILFSGHANSADFLEMAHKAGHSFEVLTKPVHPSEILDRVKHLCTSRPADSPSPPPHPAPVERLDLL